MMVKAMLEDLGPIAGEIKAQMLQGSTQVLDEIPDEMFATFFKLTHPDNSEEARIEMLRMAVADHHLVRLIIIGLTIGSVQMGVAWSEYAAKKGLR